MIQAAGALRGGEMGLAGAGDRERLGGRSEVWITMTLASGVNSNSSARNNNRRQNRMSALQSRQETGARDKSKYGSETETGARNGGREPSHGHARGPGGKLGLQAALFPERGENMRARRQRDASRYLPGLASRDSSSAHHERWISRRNLER